MQQCKYQRWVTNPLSGKCFLFLFMMAVWPSAFNLRLAVSTARRQHSNWAILNLISLNIFKFTYGIRLRVTPVMKRPSSVPGRPQQLRVLFILSDCYSDFVNWNYRCLGGLYSSLFFRLVDHSGGVEWRRRSPNYNYRSKNFLLIMFVVCNEQFKHSVMWGSVVISR